MQYKLVAAMFAIVLSAPAAAWDDPQGNTVAAKPASRERTYCLQFGDDTGSHVNRIECRTKKDWARLGVDVDSLSDK